MFCLGCLPRWCSKERGNVSEDRLPLAWVGTGVFLVRIRKYDPKKEGDERGGHGWASKIDSWRNSGSAERAPGDASPQPLYDFQSSGHTQLLGECNGLLFAGFEHKRQTVAVRDVVSKARCAMNIWLNVST